MQQNKQSDEWPLLKFIWMFSVIVILAGLFSACSSHSDPYGKIIDDSKKAIVKNPQDAQAYMQLGQIYLQLGKFRKALEIFLKRSLIPPDDINTEYYIGVCYEELGFYRKALAQYRKVLPVDKTLANKLLNQITQ